MLRLESRGGNNVRADAARAIARISNAPCHSFFGSSASERVGPEK